VRSATNEWTDGFSRGALDAYSLFNSHGLPTPAYYAFWLWDMYGGEALVAASASRTASRTKGAGSEGSGGGGADGGDVSGVSAYVTSFAADETAATQSDAPPPLGVLLINESPTPRSVELVGADGGRWRGTAAWLHDAERVRVVGHVVEADWVRAEDAGATDAQRARAPLLASIPTYAVAVRINGVRRQSRTHEGRHERPGEMSGPMPPSDVPPFERVLAAGGEDFAHGAITLHVPAYAVLAAALHRADDDPLWPPSPPPQPPPVWTRLRAHVTAAFEGPLAVAGASIDSMAQRVDVMWQQLSMSVRSAIVVVVGIPVGVVAVLVATALFRACGCARRRQAHHHRQLARPKEDGGEGGTRVAATADSDAKKQPTRTAPAILRQRPTRESRMEALERQEVFETLEDGEYEI
jgi:hypothetical protein